MPELILIKLGGSLITDKMSNEKPRDAVIDKLARELRDLAGERPGGVILGHGSGSFGHAVARRHGLEPGSDARNHQTAIAATQDAAARLHRRVVASLLEAGAAPFSVAPSSIATASGNQPVTFEIRALELALEQELLPVIYGDVVIDGEMGATIFSTETLFLALAEKLRERGHRIERVLWLGETPGVYDARGVILSHLSPAGKERALEVAGGAEGLDVTGGMRHRIEAALQLAQLGITSWILDGRVPGVLRRVIAEEPGLGTVVRPDRLRGS